jgi:hypothetical protein
MKELFRNKSVLRWLRPALVQRHSPRRQGAHLGKNREIARLGTDARPEIAARHGLQVVRNKILIPDLRIEYETREGDAARVNLELVTEHYRGRHVADKVRAGFSLYTPHGEADHLRRVLDQHELTAEILSL